MCVEVGDDVNGPRQEPGKIDHEPPLRLIWPPSYYACGTVLSTAHNLDESNLQVFADGIEHLRVRPQRSAPVKSRIAQIVSERAVWAGPRLIGSGRLPLAAIVEFWAPVSPSMQHVPMPKASKKLEPLDLQLLRALQTAQALHRDNLRALRCDSIHFLLSMHAARDGDVHDTEYGASCARDTPSRPCMLFRNHNRAVSKSRTRITEKVVREDWIGRVAFQILTTGYIKDLWFVNSVETRKCNLAPGEAGLAAWLAEKDRDDELAVLSEILDPKRWMPSEDNFEGDDDEDLKSDPVSQMDMKAHTVHGKYGEHSVTVAARKGERGGRRRAWRAAGVYIGLCRTGIRKYRIAENNPIQANPNNMRAAMKSAQIGTAANTSHLSTFQGEQDWIRSAICSNVGSNWPICQMASPSQSETIWALSILTGAQLQCRDTDGL
ncbi:hypothetical protein B0H21DRAFT_713271 [Amylocystis lapponica]|nr:hypothetical protein B0H21DRAFT_713271 [Amylocystis lapponica]